MGSTAGVQQDERANRARGSRDERPGDGTVALETCVKAQGAYLA